jgi:hypothetical protein
MESQETSSIEDELMRITHMIRDKDEQFRRWQLFWQKHLQSGSLVALNINVAAQATFVGATIALDQKRYDDGLDLLSSLVTHPEFARISSGWLSPLYGIEVLCLLNLGREADAAAVGHKLRDIAAPTTESLAVGMLCVALRGYFQRNSYEGISTKELTHLVTEILREVDPEFDLTALPSQASYKQLDLLVEKSQEIIVAELE